MPPREPKARYLTREYVADREFMTCLSPAEREWYLLTSLFADDDGYLEWDLEENAANIYRYDAPRTREARVSKILERLGPTRVEVLACGRHALMARVAKRPRPGGKGRDRQVRLDHESRCEPTKGRADTSGTQLGVESGVNSLPRPRPIPDPRPTPVLDQTSRTGAPARGGAPSAIGDVFASAGVDPASWDRPLPKKAAS